MVSDNIMYAEVFEILGYMNKQEVMRIPINILEYIKQERMKNYISRIDKYDLFNPDNIDARTVNFLAWLMMDYMANDEQRNILIKKAKENDRIKELEKRKKYTEIVFENENRVKIESKEIETIIVEDTDSKNKQLIVPKKRSIFNEIANVFKSIFINRGKDG